MSDPLSTSGLGVSGVSLLLQVCQGLVEYYKDFKAYNTDVALFCTLATSIENSCMLPLKSLEEANLDVIRKDAVLTCIQQCHEPSRRLMRKLSSVKQCEKPTRVNQSSTNLKLAAGFARQAFYPFHRKTILDIVQDLRVTHELVRGAQHNMHIDIDIETETNIKLDNVQKCVTESAINVQGLVRADNNRQIAEIIDWLKAPDPSVEHRDARKRHEEGTGEWFLGSDKYTDWVAGRVKHLWVYGKAGCCKNVLTSTIIEDLKQKQLGSKENLLYFYFTFSDPSKQTYRGLLQSLLTQLSQNELTDLELYEMAR